MAISVTEVLQTNLLELEVQKTHTKSSADAFRLAGKNKGMLSYEGIVNAYYYKSFYEQEIANMPNRIKELESDPTKCNNEQNLLSVYEGLLEAENAKIKLIENDPRYDAQIIQDAIKTAETRLEETNKSHAKAQDRFEKKQHTNKYYYRCIDELNIRFSKNGSISISEFNAMLSFSGLDPEDVARLKEHMIYNITDRSVIGFKREDDFPY